MYVAEESNSCIIYQWSDPFFRLYTLLILALGWAVHIITHSNPTSHCSASAMTLKHLLSPWILLGEERGEESFIYKEGKSRRGCEKRSGRELNLTGTGKNRRKWGPCHLSASVWHGQTQAEEMSLRVFKVSVRSALTSPDRVLVSSHVTAPTTLTSDSSGFSENALVPTNGPLGSLPADRPDQQHVAVGCSLWPLIGRSRLVLAAWISLGTRGS